LFRAEVVLPKEIKHRSLRIAVEVPSCPYKAKEKDLLESDRLKAVVNLQKYQEETRSWCDPKVKTRELNVGDLVLLLSPQTESSGKLESKWEGPCMVMEKTSPGAYRLVDPQEKKPEHSWNVDNLHRFYV
jgi:hypothetical protein